MLNTSSADFLVPRRCSLLMKNFILSEVDDYFLSGKVFLRQYQHVELRFVLWIDFDSDLHLSSALNVYSAHLFLRRYYNPLFCLNKY